MMILIECTINERGPKMCKETKTVELNPCRRCMTNESVMTSELPHPHHDLKVWAVGCGICDFSIIGNRSEDDAKIDWNLVNPKSINNPHIVTLCGSSRFCAEMAVLAWEFEKGGRIALGLHLLPQSYCEQKGMKPDTEGKIHHIGEQEGVEDDMDMLHLRKIEMADSVYIVNVDGYIGESTKREIAYAERLGKPISYLEGI